MVTNITRQGKVFTVMTKVGGVRPMHVIHFGDVHVGSTYAKSVINQLIDTWLAKQGA